MHQQKMENIDSDMKTVINGHKTNLDLSDISVVNQVKTLHHLTPQHSFLMCTQPVTTPDKEV